MSIEAPPQLLATVEVPCRLDHVEFSMQNHVDPLPPIVAVARDDQRRISGHFAADEIDQECRLPHAAALDQTEVRVDQMKVPRAA